MTTQNAGVLTQFSELGAYALKSLLEQVADILLLVGDDGQITDVSGHPQTLDRIGAVSWTGKALRDVMSIGDHERFQKLLSSSATGSSVPECVLNHSTSDGGRLTIAYTLAPPMEGVTGLVLGQDISKFAALQNRIIELNQAIGEQRDAQKRVEGEYQTLFSIGSEPILIVDVKSRQITASNPAAVKMLGRDNDTLSQQSFVSLFHKSDQKDLNALIAAVMRTSAPASAQPTLADGQAIVVNASPDFGSGTSVILRLSMAGTPRILRSDEDFVIELVRAATEAVVVTDEAGRIVWQNRAFEDLVSIDTSKPGSAVNLGRFFDPKDLDFSTVLRVLRDNPHIRSLPASLMKSNGRTVDIELSGTVIPDATPRRMGFIIRDISIRSAAKNVTAVADSSIEAMLHQIGKAPLRELVQEETAVLEKNLILAALKLTGNNRAATAKVLGLSRQGLYSKLDRYGVGTD